MDLSKYLIELQGNTTAVLAATELINETQTGPELPGKWSALQILEHIYLTDRLVVTLVSRPSATVSPNLENIGNDKLQHWMVAKAASKVSAPELLHPKGRFKTTAEFSSAFAELRAGLADALASGKVLVDQRTHKHPLIGEMTISDWLYFVIHHTQRHLLQMEGLKKEGEK